MCRGKTSIMELQEYGNITMCVHNKASQCNTRYHDVTRGAVKGNWATGGEGNKWGEEETPSPFLTAHEQLHVSCRGIHVLSEKAISNSCDCGFTLSASGLLVGRNITSRYILVKFSTHITSSTDQNKACLSAKIVQVMMQRLLQNSITV